MYSIPLCTPLVLFVLVEFGIVDAFVQDFDMPLTLVLSFAPSHYPSSCCLIVSMCCGIVSIEYC